MGKNLDDLRDRVYPIIDPLTRWLVKKRVHPNLITTSGFAVTVFAGAILIQQFNEDYALLGKIMSLIYLLGAIGILLLPEGVGGEIED